MTVSAENAALSSKLDTAVDLIYQLVNKVAALKAEIAANGAAASDVADNTAAVVADAAKLDPAISAAQSALG